MFTCSYPTKNEVAPTVKHKQWLSICLAMVLGYNNNNNNSNIDFIFNN